MYSMCIDVECQLYVDVDPHVRVALLSLKPPPSPLCVAMTFSALDLMMVPSIATKVHKDEGVREGMEERKQ